MRPVNNPFAKEIEKFNESKGLVSGETEPTEVLRKNREKAFEDIRKNARKIQGDSAVELGNTG